MNIFSPIPVETGVPIPDRSHFHQKYPFPQMAVGDSFFLAGYQHMNINSSIAWASRNGRKFVARRVTCDGVRGLRVWRIA